MLSQDARTLRLFSLMGVPVRIHPVVLLVIGLLLIYQVTAADSEGHVSFLLQGLLLVLVSVFVHELGHAVAARRLGIPVADITLNVFYAVTRTGRPESPAKEIVVASGGPAASLTLCGLLFALSLGMEAEDPATGEPLRHAVLINLLLGAANLLPAFPMDGGRIVRALLQVRYGLRVATRRAVWAGRALAALMLASPLYLGFSPLSFGLPVVALVIFALGEQELQRVCRQEVPDSAATAAEKPASAARSDSEQGGA